MKANYISNILMVIYSNLKRFDPFIIFINFKGFYNENYHLIY